MRNLSVKLYLFVHVTQISRYITLYIAFGIIRGFTVTAVGLGTYCPWIRRATCILKLVTRRRRMLSFISRPPSPKYAVDRRSIGCYSSVKSVSAHEGVRNASRNRQALSLDTAFLQLTSGLPAATYSCAWWYVCSLSTFSLGDDINRYKMGLVSSMHVTYDTCIQIFGNNI